MIYQSGFHASIYVKAFGLPNQKRTSFHLATKDAHPLYAQYGFKPLDYIENRMARPLDWNVINEGYMLKNNRQ